LIVIGADVLRFPDESMATAVTVCAPEARLPVSHCPVPEQLVVPVQAMLLKSEPSPYSWIVLTLMLSDAAAEIRMLLPVHTPLAGEVMATVGGVVSLVPDAVDVVGVDVEVDEVVDVSAVEVEVDTVDDVPAPEE
jgi:hypothetical protein